MKILILGGTKFAGLELVKILFLKKEFELTIASRRNILDFNVKEIDRKSLQDLGKLFTESFDLVIDFICFTKSDAEKLISALKINEKYPKILFVSTTYVYHNLRKRKKGYCENDFEASKFEEIDLDWPEVNYIDGKKSAEAYLSKNYPNELLCTLRFPVIIGNNDPTGRTKYFVELVENDSAINLSTDFSGKFNYISKIDVANAIISVVRDFKFGTYNVAVDKPLNQLQLAQLFLKLHHKSIGNCSDVKIPFSKSPFYYTDDFLVNTDKFKEQYRLDFDSCGLVQDINSISNANSDII